mmetsp:Transcript_8336/g.30095  ORF Transcript_8336/g.30095 Transcript_8336/m.30095 type:complete len:129 (-) Transcript_8336:100-486(-)
MKDSMAEEYLQSRIQQAKQEIAKIEKRVYDAETEYFSCESSQMGTVLKGYEGFLSSKDNMRKRARTFKIEDRLFSLSSRTSPAAKEEEREAENQKSLRDSAGNKGLTKRSRSGREFKHSRSTENVGRY